MGESDHHPPPRTFEELFAECDDPDALDEAWRLVKDLPIERALDTRKKLEEVLRKEARRKVRVDLLEKKGDFARAVKRVRRDLQHIIRRLSAVPGAASEVDLDSMGTAQNEIEALDSWIAEEPRIANAPRQEHYRKVLDDLGSAGLDWTKDEARTLLRASNFKIRGRRPE